MNINTRELACGAGMSLELACTGSRLANDSSTAFGKISSATIKTTRSSLADFERNCFSNPFIDEAKNKLNKSIKI